MNQNMNKLKIVFFLLITLFISGCDIIFEDKSNSSKKIKLAEKQTKIFGKAINYPEIKISKILRADLFAIVSQGKTQNIHLTGILAPTPQSSRYNRFLERKFKFDKLTLQQLAYESLNFIKEITDDRAQLLKVISSRTNDTGIVIIEGDILFADNSSLSGKLVANGFAVVYSKSGEKFSDLERSEKIARNSEAGLWKNTMDFHKRFRVESDFEFKTLSVQTDKVRAQSSSATASGTAAKNSGHVLESHRTFEKQAEIIVEIDTQKPLQRTYQGVAKYTFHTKKSVGKRQQEVSLAAPRGTLKRDGTYKPLSSSDQTKKRRDDRKVRDYNKKVKGQTVYSNSEFFNKSDDFELNCLSTNLVFISEVVEYMESKKAGVNYETGTRYVGYDLEVWIEGTLVYSHKLKR